MKDWENWEKRRNAARAAVDPAQPRFVEYWRCILKPLSVRAGQGMRPETRAKLEALARSGDPETRSIAQQALAGHSYFDD